ncbi:MAG: AAA family ATPase [Alphaproteobacteria bacterium]|nr:AAA family ATPase [Alphaproteobacteria bacterium]
MHITAITLSGFKSFAESTHLSVDRGLTVVIGPNGCGKSNIIEAVRWVMGENSAKRLRGAEMEDVIFAGTRQRRRRQSAEVRLTLDNQARRAPAPFQDVPEIVVSRRIERGQGSTYQINNQEVRACDVQMLFADLSIGSRSASIISQGEIAELVENKPDARRLLLEEAAGIRGLHARRHDAELKLSQAEGNLQRLGDICEHGQAELQSLERQARATRRYRELMAQKRQYQALHWWLQDRDLASEQSGLAEEHRVKREAYQQAVTQQNTSTIDFTRAETALLQARTHDAELIKVVQRARNGWRDLELKREALEVAQAHDVERAEEWRGDLERLEDELLGWMQCGMALEQEKVVYNVETLDIVATESLGQKIVTLGEEVAALEERCAADACVRGDQQRGQMRLEERLRGLKHQQGATQAESVDVQERLTRLRRALAELPDDSRTAQDDNRDWIRERAEAESRLQDAYTVWAAKRDRPAAMTQAKATLDAKAAEIAQLAQRARSSTQQWRDWQMQQEQRLAACWVAPVGLEAAIGAALGVGMRASLEYSSGYYWYRADSQHHAAPEFPIGVASLWDYLTESGATIPLEWAVLRLPLQWTGLVADEAECRRFLPELNPGQGLVTREGAGIRWDGLGHGVHAATIDAEQWAQGNIWAQLEAELIEQQAALAEAQEVYRAAEEKWQDEHDVAEADYRRLEQMRDALNVAWGTVRRELEETEIKHRAVHAQRQRLEVETAVADVESKNLRARTQAVSVDLAEAEAVLAGAENIAPDADARVERLKACRARWSELKEEKIRLDAVQHSVAQARQQRTAEAVRLDTAQRDSRGRIAALEQKLQDLEARQTEQTPQLAMLCVQAQEAEMHWQQQDLAQQEAASRVQDALRIERESQQGRYRCEMQVAQRREELAGVETSMEHKAEARRNLQELAQQATGETIARLMTVFEFSESLQTWFPAQANEAIAQASRRLEALGEVNLRAEIDTEHKRAELQLMASEYADIQAAINNLRNAIGDLNQQGRARLRATFKGMKVLFGEYFQRLFSGGEANLVWIETEDPIAPGIDIRARPPGKAMQSVYLLSGGEKALTALALIGAVLRLRPTPICLLDEVDAALDDANVARFCALLAELGTSAQEMRFVIISHHRLSMAKADHLFGVGMPERGVSRLYAVDMLEAAEHIHQSN